jgi:hypothetical protein
MLIPGLSGRFCPAYQFVPVLAGSGWQKCAAADPAFPATNLKEEFPPDLCRFQRL